MNEYGSEIQDIESVFHISESCAPSSCFCNEQKDTDPFAKALFFALHTARQKASPFLLSSLIFPR